MPTRRVLVIGSWEPGALAKSYTAGFIAAGCDTSHFDPTASPSTGLLSRLGMRLGPRRRQIWDRWQEHLIEAATARRPDLILVLKGHWLDAGTVHLLREKTGAAVANFFPDDPFHEPVLRERLHGAVAAYDRFFTFVHAFIPRLVSLGGRASFLPFAWDPAMHPAASQFSRDLCDVSFVGNWSEDRELWLEQLHGFDLGLWGTWNRLATCTPLRRAVRGPPKIEAAMVPILSRTAITLNLIRVVSNGHNMRSYEALGIGAFLLSNRTPELTGLFREDQDIVCFSTPAELRDKVRFYLGHDTERLRIAASGHLRVAPETYTHRAHSILTEIFGHA